MRTRLREDTLGAFLEAIRGKSDEAAAADVSLSAPTIAKIRRRDDSGLLNPATVERIEDYVRETRATRMDNKRDDGVAVVLGKIGAYDVVTGVPSRMASLSLEARKQYLDDVKVLEPFAAALLEERVSAPASESLFHFWCSRATAAMVSDNLADVRSASPLAANAVRAAKAWGDKEAIAVALWLQGSHALSNGEPGSAIEMFNESESEASSGGGRCRHIIWRANDDRGRARLEIGAEQLEDARRDIALGSAAVDQGDPFHAGMSLINQAELSIALGRYDDAVTHLLHARQRLTKTNVLWKTLLGGVVSRLLAVSGALARSLPGDLDPHNELVHARSTARRWGFFHQLTLAHACQQRGLIDTARSLRRY